MELRYGVVDAETGCWYASEGGRSWDGYQRALGGYLHVIAWEVANGRGAPEDMHVDHTCGNRACYNPAHLELVTPSENSTRMGRRVKACRKAGHPYTPENTYVARNGGRSCKQCRRDAMQRFRESSA